MPITSATPNHEVINVLGSATIFPGEPIFHYSGIILHINAVQSATFSGTFEGVVEVEWHIIINGISGQMKTVGMGNFTGYMFKDTPDEKWGTFTFTTVGNGIGFNFYNEWNVIKGTDGLSNIHGKGTLSGTISLTDTYEATYSGLVFFSP